MELKGLQTRGRALAEVKSRHFCKYSNSKIKAVPSQAKQVERGGRCIVPPVLDSRETRHPLLRTLGGPRGQSRLE
jgi:hypothetical protein